MRTIRLTLIALSILALVAAGCGNDSTAATTPTGDDGGAEQRSTLDPTRAADLTELWRLDAPSGVTGTPVIVGETTYFADWDGRVGSIETATGRENWSTALSGQVSSSPAIADGILYVVDLSAVLHALEVTDGSVMWSTRLDHQDGAAGLSSPVVAGDRIIVGISSVVPGGIRGSIIAVDADSGDEIWRTWTDTGTENQGRNVSVWSTAAVDDARSLVFIGTGNTNEPVMTASGSSESHLANSILALDLDDGSIAWMYRFVENDRSRDFDVGARPNLFSIDGRDVVGVGAKAGDYAVLDRETGAEIWRVSLTAGSAIGGVMGAAAVDGDDLVVSSNIVRSFGDFSARVFSLDPATGATRWETELEGLNIAGASVVNGVAYVGTAHLRGELGWIYALDTSDGTILWSDEPGSRVGSSVTPSGDLVLAGIGFGFSDGAGGFPPVDNGALVAYGIP